MSLLSFSPFRTDFVFPDLRILQLPHLRVRHCGDRNRLAQDRRLAVPELVLPDRVSRGSHCRHRDGVNTPVCEPL